MFKVIERHAFGYSFSPSVAGFGLAGCFVYLALLSLDPVRPTLIEFGGLMALGFAFYARAYFDGGNTEITARTLLFWAIVFRLVGCWGEPLFEDDFYRYLWDGYRFAVDGTPYGRTPETFFNDLSIPHIFQPILGQINHPDIPTIYGPTFEYLFLLAYWVAPGQLWALKMLLVGCDLALVLLLIRLAGPRNALLYAWNPLVIKEIAFTAHPDGLIPLLLISAWYLGQQQRQFPAGLALAMAAAAKASIWLIVPFLLLGFGFLGLFAFVVFYGVLYLPFYWQGATDLAGLQAFAGSFEFNSAGYGLLALFLPALWAKAILGLVLLVGTAWYLFKYWRRKPRALVRGDWLFGGLLLVSPVFNPWYLLWLLPFASVYPSLTAWTASASLLLAYVTGLNLDSMVLLPYEHPVWLRPLEFGVLGVAVVVEVLRYRYRKAIL